MCRDSLKLLVWGELHAFLCSLFLAPSRPLIVFPLGAEEGAGEE